VGGTGMLFYLSPSLALLSLSLSPPVAVAGMYYGRYLQVSRWGEGGGGARRVEGGGGGGWLASSGAGAVTGGPRAAPTEDGLWERVRA
jgi:hypothetical protein